MKRIASGVIDQYIYFKTGITGISSFTVYHSRNGGASALMAAPTIVEIANMGGVYALLANEDMDIDAENITEHMVFSIAYAGGGPQYIEIELFNPELYRVDTYRMNGARVFGSGTSLDKWHGGTE